MSADFKVTAEQLSDCFKPDSIHDGESLKKLQALGGWVGIEQALKTNLKNGIENDQQEIQSRIAKFGDNNPVQKEPPTLWQLILEAFEDKILRILCLSAIVSLLIGILENGWQEGWIEGSAILVAVVIIVTVTSGNNYMKEKQFRKLNERAQQRNIMVTRSGQMLNIDVKDLLVGDIVQIETGEILPVDGIVIKSNNLTADESSVTGESDPILKIPPKTFEEENLNCFLISGSKIIDGTGTIIVFAVGKNTQWGKLKMILDVPSDDTPLQQKLAVLADDIGNLGMYCAIGTFVAMTLHLLGETFWNSQSIFSLHILQEIIEYFVIAITIIVVAVPEGLPLAVTIALAYSVGKMKDENNLVRYLQACETMGGANNICSDKTGTLTQNRMSVVQLFALQKVYGESNFNKEFSQQNKEFFDKLCIGLCVNSNANPEIINENQFEQIGNKTECSLIELAYKFGYDYRVLRKQDEILRILPFSSARKKMTTVWQSPENKQIRVFLKGAIDYILPSCTHYLDHNGIQQKITDQYKGDLLKIVDQFAKQSLRTILLTYKDLPQDNIDYDQIPEEELERDLTIIGLTGIKDPLRPQIVKAVQQCKSAGVTVRMVTGDIMTTAIAISIDAGILPPGYEHNENLNEFTVMEGKRFRDIVGGVVQVPDPQNPKEMITEVKCLDKFKTIAKHLRVLARSTPEDKFILVTGLKQLENVVAVTGDGTNDAPALKKADVGFAMGIAGTEVCKESAGIILLDDNFASIITAIKWGRNIFECIRKFLQFQLTVNIVAMALTFIGGLIIRESPLNSIQMLWVNLIMDTMGSLALATEPPSEELLQRSPYSRKEYIITPTMWRNILGHAIFQITVLNVILFQGHKIFDVPKGLQNSEWTYENGKHLTIFFNIFVFMQVFNEINSRKLKMNELNVFKGFLNNLLFVGVLIFTILVQYFIVQYGGKAVHCSPLTIKQHLYCIGIGLLSLLVGVFIKLIPERMFNTLKLFRETQEFMEIDKKKSSWFKHPTMMRAKLSMIRRRTCSYNEIQDKDFITGYRKQYTDLNDKKSK